MSGNVSLSAREFDRLMAAAQAYPENAEKAINDVLHKQAGPLISQRINPLIHPSGRTFKGHRASAVASDWPRYDIDENLAVSVGRKGVGATSISRMTARTRKTMREASTSSCAARKPHPPKSCKGA